MSSRLIFHKSLSESPVATPPDLIPKNFVSSSLSNFMRTNHLSLATTRPQPKKPDQRPEKLDLSEYGLRAELFPTDFLDRFTFLRKIAKQGNQGQVFLIREGLTGNDFAAKIYTATEEEKVPLIKTEAKILGFLSHPSIIRFKQFYCREEEGVFILITEYFRGVPLGQFIETCAPEKTEKVEICRAIVEVVNHLIDNQVIHGDFNSSNILINPQTKEIRLIDFGLSQMGAWDPIGFQSPKGFLSCRPPLSREAFYQGDLYDVWGMILVLISLLLGQNVGSRGLMKLMEIEKGGRNGDNDVWKAIYGYLINPKSAGLFLKDLLSLFC